MNVVCENANSEFQVSLESVDCCDYCDDGVVYVRAEKSVRFFSEEYEVIDGVVYGVNKGRGNACRGNNCNVEGDAEEESGASVKSGASDCRCNNELFYRLLMREPIQLLHDLSIQLSKLHREGYTLTDVDICDIANVDGRFCLCNDDKLVKLDGNGGYGSLIFPPMFGKFVAPELRGIRQIPAKDVVHKNSAVWSIGAMFAKYVLNVECVCEGGSVESACDCVYFQIKNNYYDDILSSIAPVVCRCVHSSPESRILIVV
jgi:hypothetical protein